MPSITQKAWSYRVQHEAVDTLTSWEDHHGGTTVKSIASCHDVSPRLQSILLRWLIICGLWSNGVYQRRSQKWQEEIKKPLQLLTLPARMLISLTMSESVKTVEPMLPVVCTYLILIGDAKLKDSNNWSVVIIMSVFCLSMQHYDCFHYLLVDSKNCPNGDKTVDVWRTIQWVEAHNVFSLSFEKKITILQSK